MDPAEEHPPFCDCYECLPPDTKELTISEFITEHEYDPLLFECPDCKKETEAHLLVDRRDVGSGCTWVVCNECYGRRYDGGMWELEDVIESVTLA